MDPMMLRGLVAVQSAPAHLPSEPAKAVQRVYPGVPQDDDPVELQRLSRARTVPAGSGSGTSTPREGVVDDLEMSRPSSPILPRETVEALPGIWDPYMNRFRFLATCLVNFRNGLNDSAPGALIPYMETHYNIGYGIVSLIFVGNALGFILAACFIDAIRERLGRAKTMALGESLLVGANIIMVCTAPFPAIPVAFFLIGFGMSLNLAMGNVFCGSLRNATAALGGMHGSYGIGGTIGPLIATSIASAGTLWSRFYFVTLALTLFNGLFVLWSFWHYENETARLQPAATAAASRPAATSGRRSASVQGMLSALSSRVVLLGALFIFAYQGAEVSISGWVISFLISTRDGDPSKVGYVTAGFWAGITLGRFLLSAPAQRVGEKRFVYAMILGAAVFELLVWLVPNVIGDAVAVAIVGLVLGPIYPCAAAVFLRCLSKSEQVSGLSVISAFGSSGGAAAPFTTGILAQAVGTFVLHPIAIALFGAMTGCWFGLPHKPKRME